MITDSRISWGDLFGAQLTTLASLTYICEENDQKLILWRELKNFRRGYQFLDYFEINNVEMITRSSPISVKLIDWYCSKYKKIGSWQKQMQRIYGNKFYYYIDRIIYEFIRLHYRDFELIIDKKNDVTVDKELLELKNNQNYDIVNGFGTCREWDKIESIIKKNWRFKKEICVEGDKLYNELNLPNKEVVSVHFRRTDYLVLSSLNLGNDYYEKAMGLFDKNNSVFLIFSDDIEGCKNMELFNGKEVVFMPTRSAGIDMYLMSKCDSNIIANSSFSFWAAYMNRSANKKVICPHDYIGESSKENLYMNGNYYPDSWIAI